MKIKMNEGRKVKRVAVQAPATAAKTGISAAIGTAFQPPIKPTKATIMMSGPGVASPSASPSIIWVALNQ
ncbi:hypothetical protein D3C83_88410 [compost metagenome]